MCKNAVSEFSSADRDKVKEIISEQKGVQGALIPVLHNVQEHFGYVPYDAQKIISEEMNIPLTEIYGVITFYSRFTLVPTGKYKVSVCLGTACYVRGSDHILEEVEKEIGVKDGQSSEDGLFSIEATRCVGACGLAPVMTVNEDVYGKVTPEQIKGILAKYK